ncbi:hypothetical protein ONZ45_g12827 [Pleurotus djamor]|nr:hypothetical protein ONZ45_g12827 [Pleurotus djamor]
MLRIVPRLARQMSTTRDENTLKNAFQELAGSVPNSIAKSSTSVPAIPPSPARTPTIMDIPPESDPLLSYLTNSLMKDGKRARAARTTSRMLLHIHAFTRADPVPIFREAIRLASPAVKSLIHRVASKNVAKPVPLGEKERVRYAVQWILKASEKKPASTAEERLAREIIAIIQGNSDVLKTKEEVHRFAMVNRGNARSH